MRIVVEVAVVAHPALMLHMIMVYWNNNNKAND
jgi:hypothetical protein